VGKRLALTAQVQDLTLKDLTLSDEFDDIHCVFCLTEDDDLANESVILRSGSLVEPAKHAMEHCSSAALWKSQMD
jgi:hypothetical protein